MLIFKNINVNPKNRKTGDCSTRALCACLNISYEDALTLQYNEAITSYYDLTSKQVMEKILEKFGYVKMKQPRKLDGTKYLVSELDQITTEEERKAGILVTVANHHTCVYENSVVDIWDCRNKAIGNYYKRIKDIHPDGVCYGKIHALISEADPSEAYRII